MGVVGGEGLCEEGGILLLSSTLTKVSEEDAEEIKLPFGLILGRKGCLVLVGDVADAVGPGSSLSVSQDCCDGSTDELIFLLSALCCSR